MCDPAESDDEIACWQGSADAERRVTGILDTLHSVFDHLGVPSCVWNEALLGVCTNDGRLLPWLENVHMLASRDALYACDPHLTAFCSYLAYDGCAAIPFYGGLRVFRTSDPPVVGDEGYTHAWPVVDVYFYQHQTRRVGTDHTDGVIVQTRPVWQSTLAAPTPTQVWIRADRIEPCTAVPFVSEVGMVRIPRDADALVHELFAGCI